MINAKLAVAIACSAALSACVTPYSGAPIAENLPANSQHKFYVADWEEIAKDLTRKIQANMAGKVGKNQAIYVSSKGSSPFQQAVVGEIISGLVADGYIVSKTATNALNMLVDTQVIEFNKGISPVQTAGISSVSTPKTEIIINVAVENASQYLAVTRGIYYISNSDAALYRGSNAYIVRTHNFAVKGSY